MVLKTSENVPMFWGFLSNTRSHRALQRPQLLLHGEMGEDGVLLSNGRQLFEELGVKDSAVHLCAVGWQDGLGLGHWVLCSSSVPVLQSVRIWLHVCGSKPDK